MDPSPTKALWDGLSPNQEKEMANIVARWLADGQAEDADDQMKDVDDDDPVLPSSFSSTAPSSSSIVPPSPMHCTMTIGEVHAHYMDMVHEEQFREA
uniref:Uncharacterized protein n=1 Tax=Hordeum vulgare subsp. vulgare TaxID=112509 RepID=A0A023IN87_HORVV|nr:hypothetical protein [Hordeum vulgare subsp. vulgare]QGH59155.1 hypothetical protein [Hordeum vulgare subsp. vulgare]